MENKDFADLNDEEKGWANTFKGLGFSRDEIYNNLLPETRKAAKQENERKQAQERQRQYELQNKAKPLRSTPEQMNAIHKHALKEFGKTNNFHEAFYMLPNGTMLNGSGGSGRRIFDHRDIGSAYLNANVDLQETDQGGNSHNMMDFMRGGNLRIMPESNSIDIMSKPTPEQMNAIYRLFRAGKLNNLQVSDAEDKFGRQKGYLEDIQNERQISDFIRKYF